MRIMRVPFKILTVAGCWPPNSWSSLCERMVYGVYTIFLTLMLFTFVLPQFMDIVLNVDNPDDFTDTFYIMMALVLACVKMLGLLLNRKNIKALTDALSEKPFRPLQPDEIEIRQKFDDEIQIYTIVYTIIIEVTCASMTLTSLFVDFRRGKLAYREWTPYYSDALFYVIYFRQLISLTIASIVNAACDSMVCGLLLHICCQLEILKCRLKRSLRNRDSLGECVRQHDRIYKLAFMINETFRAVIAIQFTASTMVVCSNLYQLAKTTLSPKYIPLILYTICMLLQILIYCWYGNEVKLKSVQLADDIFEMDWPVADKKTREDLIVIMNRCLVPIEFSSAHLFTMNLDSFGKMYLRWILKRYRHNCSQLLKTSYSVYSVLQHM